MSFGNVARKFNYLFFDLIIFVRVLQRRPVINSTAFFKTRNEALSPITLSII